MGKAHAPSEQAPQLEEPASDAFPRSARLRARFSRNFLKGLLTGWPRRAQGTGPGPLCTPL